jgi:hypothetical protein
MKKHKLFWEEDYDFDLIGICSSYTDYRLCWTINNALSIQLQKGEDYALKNKKDGEFFFSFYEYIDEETRTAFFLVKNQSYNYNNDIQQLVSNIKTIESVMTAFVFDVQELKSKANLIF